MVSYSGPWSTRPASGPSVRVRRLRQRRGQGGQGRCSRVAHSAQLSASSVPGMRGGALGEEVGGEGPERLVSAVMAGVP